MSGAGRDAFDDDERRRALRALLRSPLLSARGGQVEELVLVRRHAAWLRDWFARHPGWQLHVDTEHARLRKTPGRIDDPTRPALNQTGAALTRRQYAVLCLALAALERTDRQITLGRLAEEIAALAASDPVLADAGFELDLLRAEHRRDLVHAVRALLERGVLVHRHGDDVAYLRGRGDVLYDVNRPVLAAMLSVDRGPSLIEAEAFDDRIRQLSSELTAEAEDARARAIRSSLNRQLLDDPVVYYDDLSEPELAYLLAQRGHILRQLEEATGLLPEIRREGIALVDERADLTDVKLPEEGTSGHATLLVAEFLSQRLRSDPAVQVGRAELHAHVASLIEHNRKYWRKDATVSGAEVGLTEEVLDRLEKLRLIERTDLAIRPRAAITRYALAAPRLVTEEPGR